MLRGMITPAGTAWPERYSFSRALRVGNLLFISGTTATDEQGKIVEPGDSVGQTRAIYQKFATLLAAAGAGCEHIVEAVSCALARSSRSLRWPCSRSRG